MHNHQAIIDKMSKLREFVMFKLSNYKNHPDYIKNNGGINYLIVDAGMNTLLRPALYDAYHHVVNASRLNSRSNESVNICGQICENTDILAKNRKLGNIKEGDLLAILNVGAYGFSMSSQYNTRPRAAEVMINKKNCKCF